METSQLGVLWLIFTCLGICALIFGIRYMRNKENMSMIEKGMDPRVNRPAPFRSLKWGLLLVGAGLGLFVAYLLDNMVFYRIGGYGRTEMSEANIVIYFALIAVGGGLGLVGSYRIEKKEWFDKEK